MEKTELQDKRDIIEKESSDKHRLLDIDFALSHNRVTIGDFVTDKLGVVLVDKILVRGGEVPVCVYRGLEYTKQFKPKKREQIRDLYQSNLVSIGKP